MTLPAPDVSQLVTQANSDHRKLALFLDIDGTLLEFAEQPHLVKVSGALQSLLGSLSKTLNGAVSLISGRRIADIDRLFKDVSYPVAGVHGLERRTADGRLIEVVDSNLDESLMSELLDLGAIDPDILIENKERTIAIHYRQAPGIKTELQTRIQILTAGRPDLLVLNGNMVFEIKTAGTDKGSAINAFMQEEPFKGRIPVFLGDDETDEAGFDAVRNRNGVAVLVGADKPTKAEFQLASVADAHEWLDTLNRYLASAH